MEYDNSSKLPGPAAEGDSRAGNGLKGPKHDFNNGFRPNYLDDEQKTSIPVKLIGERCPLTGKVNEDDLPFHGETVFYPIVIGESVVLQHK